MLFDQARLERLLQESRANCLLALTAPNIFYLTGWRKGRGAAALVRPDDARLVVPNPSLDYVLEGVDKRVDVIAYGNFIRFKSSDGTLNDKEERVARLHDAAATTSTLGSSLRALLQGTGISILCDVGVDECAALSASLQCSVHSDPGAFTRLRAVKTKEEIRRLRAAAEVTETAIHDVVSECRVGISQAELARAFAVSLARNGARLRLDNVSLGRSTAFGNANLPEDKLLDGEIVRFDVGAIVEGYESDVARCFAFGAVPEKVSSYYAALVAGQQVAMDVLRPGVLPSELWHAAVSTARREGIPHYDRTHVGHGIGIHGDGYDPPLLSPEEDSPMEEGMVLCVETPYYELGFGGLQVEDMVVVTADGYEILTTSSRELRTVG
jgi:Xaa-Pro dipeptidase